MSKKQSTKQRSSATSSAIREASPGREQASPATHSGRWSKVFFGLCVLWVQVLFFGLLWGMDGLVHWGLALFFVMIGVGFVGLGVSWSTAAPMPRPEPHIEPEPAILPPTSVVEATAAATAYCLVCDEHTGRMSARPRQCLACGFEPSTESPGEALLKASDGLRELRQWQKTLQQWLATPSQDTAMQVYQCSAALVAIVSRFPCLKEVSQANPSASGASGNADESLYTTPSDRTWGDAELVLDEIYAAQEKTQVDVAGGSQRGLLQQALLYTKQLKARLQKHIRELNYCADGILEIDAPRPDHGRSFPVSHA